MSERCGWLLLEAARLPGDDGFLSPAERARAAALTVGPRRRDFRLGRLAARLALGAWTGRPPPGPEVEIAAEPGGAPRVLAADAPALSLSHRDGVALCALARGGLRLGADLERVEPRSEGLLDQFFTGPEAAWVRAASSPDRDERANLLWSAKESAAKALGEGLRLDTRTLEVEPPPGGPGEGGWRPLAALTPCGRLTGWWRREGPLVVTVLADAPLAPPERLGAP